MTTRLIHLLAAAVLLLGCASNGEPVTDPVCIGDTFPPSPDFVGLDGAEAEALAAERGLQVREVGRDGECFAVTDDLREDRINLEYSGDHVIAASIY